MSRLIDADALIDDIRKHSESYFADDFAREWVDRQPTVEPQWIPVSERLPDIGEHYVSEPCLCYCSNGAYCFGELQENVFGQVGWDCERDDEYHEAIGEVIAWLPLPKPYEGGEDDE